MIKLTRASKPAYLTDDKVAELTEEFKSSSKTVWDNDNIKTSLLNSSFNKCAYCECPLTKESNYMEVEHFEDKKHNPDKVVAWENLLPSCKKCNSSKGIHNVVGEPIVNPYTDDPKEHLALRLYRIRGKTSKGISTIEVTNLNHSDRLVFSRYEIGEKIDELLDTALERLETYETKNDTRSRNRLIKIIEGLLMECQPSASYSAATATNLLTDSKFNDLVGTLKAKDIWSAELDELLKNASTIVLDCA